MATLDNLWKSRTLSRLLEDVWFSSLRGGFGGERRKRRVALLLSDEEHEKQWFRTWCGFYLCLRTLSNSGMSQTIEQAVTQLQQEVITLKAQIADGSGMAETVSATNNLTTARVRKDATSLIDVNGFGSFEGVDWQGGRFSAVVEEDGGILCWCHQGVRR